MVDHLNNKVDNSALLTATGAAKITSTGSGSADTALGMEPLHLTRPHTELTMEGYNMPF